MQGRNLLGQHLHVGEELVGGQPGGNLLLEFQEHQAPPFCARAAARLDCNANQVSSALTEAPMMASRVAARNRYS
jgi:hypothetical protein